MTKYIKPVFVPTPIIDNLTSSDTDKALSANQGKVLNDKITTLSTTTIGSITVDSLNNDEVDRSPSAHIVKDILGKKAPLVNGKIPLNHIPTELLQSTPDDKPNDLLAGDGILITNGSNGRRIINIIPTDASSIIAKINKAKKVKLPSKQDCIDICYCSKMKLVAAIASNNDVMFTSNDGKTWAQVSTPSSMENACMCYSSKSNKIFIVTKTEDNVLISSDGTSDNFTTSSTPTSLDPVDTVVMDNIGDNGVVGILSSTDLVTSSDGGNTWIQTVLPLQFSIAPYTRVCYNEVAKQLVLIGYKDNLVMSKAITNTQPIPTDHFTEIKITNADITLADVCYSKELDRYCAISSDSNKAYVYDGSGSKIGPIDATKWKEVTLPSSSNWIRVTYVPFYKVFFALSSTGKCAVSFDGIIWEEATLPNIKQGASKYTNVAYVDTIKDKYLCLTATDYDMIVTVGLDVP